jgi:hypothetical protein
MTTPTINWTCLCGQVINGPLVYLYAHRSTCKISMLNLFTTQELADEIVKRAQTHSDSDIRSSAVDRHEPG